MIQLDKTDIEKIIVRYINDEASKEEIEVLEQAVRAGEYKELFEAYSLSDFMSSHGLVSFDFEKARDSFMDQIDQEESRPVRNIGFRNIIRYAAAVLIGGVLLTAAITYFWDDKSTIHPDLVTLVYQDGTTTTFSDGTKDIADRSGAIFGAYDGTKLTYAKHGNKTNLREQGYNELHVPYGKKFQVLLEDGSVVYLNSGSILKYPIGFLNDQPREVHLIGQAYFKITKNEEAPFIVNTEEISTKVYGTEFNVTAYQDDKEVHVVLVEGSVGVYGAKSNKEDQITMLEPMQKAELFRGSKDIKVTEVSVENYITWKDGVLTFEDERFETIIKKLERHFNVSIENNLGNIKDYKYTGSFDIESLEEILSAFSNHSPFQYSIDGRNVIITP